MHIDWQQMMAMMIVAAAAVAVVRRVWSQIAAFRTKPGKASGGGCDGCPSSGAAKSAPSVPAPLMQIQTRPPAHQRRPSAK